LTTEFSGHGHRVSCLQMHRMNENIVISGSNDRTARIWDARVGNTAVALVAEHEDAIRRLQFDDLKLITGGVSNSFGVLDRRIVLVVWVWWWLVVVVGGGGWWFGGGWWWLVVALDLCCLIGY
jgi:WD40 repeat protein